MVQCVTVWCSVLQYVAVIMAGNSSNTVCCIALQCVAVHCSVVQCITVCCSMLQCVAASHMFTFFRQFAQGLRCIYQYIRECVLHCVAACCSVLQPLTYSHIQAICAGFALNAAKFRGSAKPVEVGGGAGMQLRHAREYGAPLPSSNGVEVL